MAGQPIFIDYFTLRVHTNTRLELGSGCSCGHGSVNNGKLYCFVCTENFLDIWHQPPSQKPLLSIGYQ